MYLEIAFLLIGGLVALVAGGELLVRGASALAAAVRISPLVIGLTVVAYGTSAPELAVSTIASFQGRADIALGNVVGSNIFNVLLILGFSALIVPLVVAQQLVRFDVPLLIGISLLTWFFGRDGAIGRLEGALFAAGLVCYTVWSVRQSRKESAAVQQEYAAEFGVPAQPARRLWLQVLLILTGLGLLVLGSNWFVSGSVEIARLLGVNDLIIGLTIVAAGTSLPEVATSILAAVRGERDIAVGNVVGSNLFNLLGVLGISAVISPQGIRVPPEALAVDIPVMVAVAIACLPIFFTGHLIARWEGALFLAYYVAYTLYLILGVTRHPALAAFGWVMISFVIPLTAITLAVIAVRTWQSGRRSA